jgi:serine/threonine protein kinase
MGLSKQLEGNASSFHAMSDFGGVDADTATIRDDDDSDSGDGDGVGGRPVSVPEAASSSMGRGGIVGTAGWQAPELLQETVRRSLCAGVNVGVMSFDDLSEGRGDSKADDVDEDDDDDDDDDASRTSGAAASGSVSAASDTDNYRRTRAVDVFALGCVVYYVVDAGGHPFGNEISRNHNILHGLADLSRVSHIPEVHDFVTKAIRRDPSLRPKSRVLLEHPLFTTDDARLAFLQVSVLCVVSVCCVLWRCVPSTMLLMLCPWLSGHERPTGERAGLQSDCAGAGGACAAGHRARLEQAAAGVAADGRGSAPAVQLQQRA